MTWPSHVVRGVITVVVATVGISIAIALRDRVDPWRATALAAGVAIALSPWTLGPRIRVLFAVTGRGALGAVALGAALLAVTHLAFQAVVVAAPGIAGSVRALYESIDVGSSRITLALLTAVVVLAEELVWRGVAIDLAATTRSQLETGIISMVLYMVPQIVGGAPLLILAAAVLGSLFAAQRIVTGRLTEPLLTHVVWSVGVFVVFPLV